MTHPQAEVVIRTAKKEHNCFYKSGCTIKPGDRYAEESLPPWAMIADDVDEEGRSIASPLGHWEHIYYHMVCFDEAMYGAHF